VGKKLCSTPPLNNHTLILCFNPNAALSFGRFVLSKEENSLLFPVPAKNIPCSDLQGIRMQDIEINIDLTLKIVKPVKKIANSLLFSLF
jgi:hypothetical protein